MRGSGCRVFLSGWTGGKGWGSNPERRSALSDREGGEGG
jgi:hypothetical protein